MQDRMAQPRYFQNPYLNEKEGELPLEASEEIRSNLKQESNRLLKILHTSLPPNVSQKRFTVYTGTQTFYWNCFQIWLQESMQMMYTFCL